VCDDALVVKQCLNGFCMQNTKTNVTSCKCKPTHTGPLCEVPVCLDYCKNGGMCDDGFGNTYEFEINSTRVAHLTCRCVPDTRYFGANCQFDRCFEQLNSCPSNCFVSSNCSCLCGTACDQSYCNNGKGACYSDEDGKLSCK
jgi:low-density lipoprotein receptor-related protein 1 (alpha-2-macroglobulin receptor)